MPRFRFTLEPLLKARIAREQVHQREVAKIRRALADAERALRRQQAQVEQGRDALRDHLVGTLDADDLRLQAGSTLQQLRTAQRMVPHLAELHRRLGAAREGLVEASRKRRAIELLRERRFAEWKREQERAETGALDELAVGRAARERSRSDQATRRPSD